MSIKVGDKVRALNCGVSSFKPLKVGEILHVVAESGYKDLLRVRDNQGTIGEVWAHSVEKVSEPTLSDLRAEALKAYDAGLLSLVECYKDFITRKDVVQCGRPSRSFSSRFTEDTVEEGFRYLQSLYTTEFKIETEEDLSRVSKGAKGVLANGNGFEVVEAPCKRFEGDTHLICTFDSFDYRLVLNLQTLKGATITQSTDN